MRFDVVSIFPEYLAPLDLSLIGKARTEGLLELVVHDLRSYTADRHRTVDDRPYGGGPGMVMMAKPLEAAINAAKQRQLDMGLPAPRVVFMSPQGKPLTHERVVALKDEPGLVVLCGRYEGVDQHRQPIRREVDGFHARVVQHEVDHLLGILYPARIRDFTKFGFTSVMFPDLDPNDDD